MASAAAAPKPGNSPHLMGKSCKADLNQKIDDLLTSLHKCSLRSSSNKLSEFEEILHSKPDPCLECVWVYASLAFNSTIQSNTEPFDRFGKIKDLFQLIISCSTSCNSIKSIALVAPVLYILHNFVLDIENFKLGSKKERKIYGEIGSLLASILGYLSVCCNGFDGNVEKLDNLFLPLGDLASFWCVDTGVQNKSVRVIFPLLSDSTLRRFSVKGPGLLDIAGFVVAEAVLFKLCWKTREEGFGLDELRSWLVGCITGLHSSYCYVTLLSMLLESALPETSLVNTEHEDGLRKVLFDALILVEYSFLTERSLGKMTEEHAGRIIFTKLMVTHDAVELSSGQGDQTKAISYLNAFTCSSIPSLITKWVRSRADNLSSIADLHGSSPRAFLKWMLDLENKGIKIFDDDMSDLQAAFRCKEYVEQLSNLKHGPALESDIIFYIDNKGREEDKYENGEGSGEEGMHTAFASAANSVQQKSSQNVGRKRKSLAGKKREQVKSVKYNATDFSSLSSESGDDHLTKRHSNGRSHIENSSSDDE